jgi:hypothetical protein
MHSYLVALRISGKGLDIAEVTAKLGIKPTQVRLRGQPRSAKSVWDESTWEYEARANNRKGQWRSLEDAVQKILSQFRPRRRTLRHYQRRFKVTLFCGHFSSSFNGGPRFSPALLKELGDFGVELYLDTYFSTKW